jgi:3-dehydroquinate synthase class II
MEDGSTKYLSELEAGDVIAISSLMEPPMRDSDGDKGIQGHWKTRGVTVGRLKVEPRPMVMLGYQSDKGAKGQIFLQQAETVRVIAPRHDACAEGAVIGIEDAPLRRGQGWQALSVTSLAVGQKVFARFTAKGTHIGKQISADVTEK